MAEPTAAEFPPLPKRTNPGPRPSEAAAKLTREGETPAKPRASARAGLPPLLWRARRGFSRALVNARSRLRYLRTERPLHLVAGIAAAAFLAGAALRMWRSSHE